MRLTKDFKRQKVTLDRKREIDVNLWYGGNYKKPTIRAMVGHIKLIRESDLEYPIFLSSDGRVIDGMHQDAKALVEGEETIEAVRFEVDPAPDYTDVHPDNIKY